MTAEPTAGAILIAVVKATRGADLDSQERHLLIALAGYANASGVCWPSLTALAEATGYSRATIARSLTGLATKGWITRTRRTCEGTSEPTSTLYQIRLDAPETGGPAGGPGRLTQSLGSLTERLGSLSQRPQVVSQGDLGSLCERPEGPIEGTKSEGQREGGEEPPPAPRISLRVKKSGEGKGTSPLPPDWHPGPELIAWAAETVGYDLQRVAVETAKHGAQRRSKGVRRADWEEDFRSWLLRAAEYDKEKGVAVQPAEGRQWKVPPELEDTPATGEDLKKFFTQAYGREPSWLQNESDEVRAANGYGPKAAGTVLTQQPRFRKGIQPPAAPGHEAWRGATGDEIFEPGEIFGPPLPPEEPISSEELQRLAAEALKDIGKGNPEGFVPRRPRPGAQPVQRSPPGLAGYDYAKERAAWAEKQEEREAEFEKKHGHRSPF